MTLRTTIEINGEIIDVKKEYYTDSIPQKIETKDTVRYSFFKSGELIGGFTVKRYDKTTAMYSKRITWDFQNKAKYNRYYLEKMAKLADKKMEIKK